MILETYRKIKAEALSLFQNPAVIFKGRQGIADNHSETLLLIPAFSFLAREKGRGIGLSDRREHIRVGYAVASMRQTFAQANPPTFLSGQK